MLINKVSTSMSQIDQSKNQLQLVDQVSIMFNNRVEQLSLSTRYIFLLMGLPVAEEVEGSTDRPTINIVGEYQVLYELLIGYTLFEDQLARNTIKFSGPPESVFQLRRVFDSTHSEHNKLEFRVESNSMVGNATHTEDEGSNCLGFYTSELSSLMAFRAQGRDELNKEIHNRLCAVVNDIQDKSETYKRLVSSDATDIDVLNLPKTDKSIIKRITHEMDLSKAAELIPLTTSGSTGEKFKLYRTTSDYWMGFYRYLLVLEAFNLPGVPSTYFPNPGLKVCEKFRQCGLIDMQEASGCIPNFKNRCRSCR